MTFRFSTNYPPSAVRPGVLAIILLTVLTAITVRTLVRTIGRKYPANAIILGVATLIVVATTVNLTDTQHAYALWVRLPAHILVPYPRVPLVSLVALGLLAVVALVVLVREARPPHNKRHLAAIACGFTMACVLFCNNGQFRYYNADWRHGTAAAYIALFVALVTLVLVSVYGWGAHSKRVIVRDSTSSSAHTGAGDPSGGV